MSIQSNPALDWARPHTARLRGVVTVLEERGLWVHGHLTFDPEARVELSFEMMHELKCLPNTYCTTLAIWRSGRCLFEFCMSTLQFKPDPVAYAQYVAPVIERLGDYYPLFDNAARFASMRERQLAR